ncbi:MAG: hydrogenase 4 subunit B [Hyphomicrobiales bacterium]|nr:hydrogenase 4 subunit B [Hyphomicrobiales bacterium]
MDTLSVTIVLYCIATLLGVGILSVAFGTLSSIHRLTYGVSLISCSVALFISGAQLATEGGSVATLTLPMGLPWLGAHFRIDALAAFFLVVLNLGAAAASLYGLGYGRHEKTPRRVLPFFPTFLAAMNLVVLADDAFTFLLSWEFMSLASWALVMAHHQNRDNVRAGYIYLVMASFGTLALLLSFGLLAGPEGAYGFTAIRAMDHTPVMTMLVLFLCLLGAGSKAGLVPLHVWLPLAHPAAPSHVSALMSGVMTKVAVYGFIRIVFDLLGEPTWWASMIVLALGGVTAVLGVLYALMQHDLKRLLAYHTVENIGIIFIGLGLAMAFWANGMGWAAALALTAALFHVLNHSVFKSLLFFGAGAILTATGQRDMERLGGLIHRMPYTSFAFLVGCTAISALPPLNGFVSEWMTFQAILQSPELPQWGLKILVPAVGALLALSAALAAACFVKAFGVTFLGRSRSPAAEQAKEVDRFSLVAMLLFALVCLLAGVLPGPIIDGLSSVTLSLLGDRMPEQSGITWFSLVPIAETRSSYNGGLVFLFIVMSALFAVYVVHAIGSRSFRRAPAWDCGFPDSSPFTQYTAGSFAQPIRRVYGTFVFRARERVDMPLPGEARPARMHVGLRDLIWDLLYAPISRAVSYAADRFNLVQFLTIRRYLSLVFISLVTLLLALALWQ